MSHFQRLELGALLVGRGAANRGSEAHKATLRRVICRWLWKAIARVRNFGDPLGVLLLSLRTEQRPPQHPKLVFLVRGHRAVSDHLLDFNKRRSGFNDPGNSLPLRG